MTSHPKYKIELDYDRIKAREIGGKKKLATTGVGAETFGAAGLSLIVFLVVSVIFGPDAGLKAAFGVGGVCLLIILAGVWIQRDYEVSLTIHEFYLEHSHSTRSAREMVSILNEAMAHDDYRIDAEAIIDAGIAGFNAAVDDDGRIQVSSVLEEAAAKLQQKMQEYKNVHNTTAEDVTRNYLEGFR